MTPEFRTEAVRLYRSSGLAVTATAREFGVSAWTLSRWVRQAGVDEGKAAWITSE